LSPCRPSVGWSPPSRWYPTVAQEFDGKSPGSRRSWLVVNSVAAQT